MSERIVNEYTWKVYELDIVENGNLLRNSPLRGHPHQVDRRHYQETFGEMKRIDLVVLRVAVRSSTQTTSLETKISSRVEQMQIQNYIKPLANIETEPFFVETFQLMPLFWCFFVSFVGASKVTPRFMREISSFFPLIPRDRKVVP